MRLSSEKTYFIFETINIKHLPVSSIRQDNIVSTIRSTQVNEIKTKLTHQLVFIWVSRKILI
jgi:hypothetical protein